MTDPIPPHADCLYAACYCEENVYKLVEKISKEHPECLPSTWAVFISNSAQQIPLWRQKSGRKDDGLVVWDYHVLLLHRNKENQTFVYDLDTSLPFPAQFSTYCEAALASEEHLQPNLHRQFRVVRASEYLASLSTDRRHMRKGEGWLQNPPSWPCIRGMAGQEHNLDMFISMDKGVPVGEVFDLKAFVNKFS